MPTVAQKAKEVSPGDELVLGEDGQSARITSVLKTGTAVKITTAVSVRTCRPDELVEIVLSGDA